MSGKYVRRNKMARVLALVLAFVLVIGASVAGTLAWLTATTGNVQNTFTSAALFENPAKEFTLWEHQAVLQADGTYELNSTETRANTYEILPGVDIPKDPTVDVVDLLEHAYLYIKVSGLPMPAGLTATVDTNNWELLAGYKDVYVFKGQYATGKSATNNVIPATDDEKLSFTVNILTGNVIDVANTYDGTAIPNVTFVAYMAQSTGAGTAAEAWEANFPDVGTKTTNP